MSAHIERFTEGWYVVYYHNGKPVDEAGPFDEEWEAEDCLGRNDHE